MNILILIIRILLGLLLIVFGSNKFIDFMPAIEFANPDAGVLFGALASSYIMKTVGLIEVIAGLLLVINKAIPFALVILAPVSINIILFHLTLDPANIAPGAFVFLLNTFFIYKYWDTYKTLF